MQSGRNRSKAPIGALQGPEVGFSRFHARPIRRAYEPRSSRAFQSRRQHSVHSDLGGPTAQARRFGLCRGLGTLLPRYGAELRVNRIFLGPAAVPKSRRDHVSQWRDCSVTGFDRRSRPCEFATSGRRSAETRRSRDGLRAGSSTSEERRRAHRSGALERPGTELAAPAFRRRNRPSVSRSERSRREVGIGVAGFEPATAGTQSRPSTRLRYTPIGEGLLTTSTQPRAKVLGQNSSHQSGTRHQHHVELNRLAVGHDQAIPREVPVLLDGDAVLADGKARRPWRRRFRAARCTPRRSTPRRRVALPWLSRAST